MDYLQYMQQLHVDMQELSAKVERLRQIVEWQICQLDKLIWQCEQLDTRSDLAQLRAAMRGRYH